MAIIVGQFTVFIFVTCSPLSISFHYIFTPAVAPTFSSGLIFDDMKAAGLRENKNITNRVSVKFALKIERTINNCASAFNLRESPREYAYEYVIARGIVRAWLHDACTWRHDFLISPTRSYKRYKPPLSRMPARRQRKNPPSQTNKSTGEIKTRIVGSRETLEPALIAVANLCDGCWIAGSMPSSSNFFNLNMQPWAGLKKHNCFICLYVFKSNRTLV